jgi:hypothetical protein
MCPNLACQVSIIAIAVKGVRDPLAVAKSMRRDVLDNGSITLNFASFDFM